MPQLMPLSWIFSSMMMFLVVVCASIIYSEEMSMVGVQNCVSEVREDLNKWCW